jgi:16S rRNA (uracil1498-N3)-methyltransferase
MNAQDRGPVATLYAPEPLVQGKAQSLGEEAAHHLRVMRAGVGDFIALRDGAGGAGEGTLVRLARRAVVVDVTDVWRIAPLAPVHLLAPIADRERMLWLAEKAAELGVTTWRPVLWRHSKSVSPRGEGTMFQQKLRARMLAALLQSQGGWLPETFPDATANRAIAASPEGTRLLLDASGEPILANPITAPATIALGPEGGFDDREHEALLNGGFKPVSLGTTRLRFETAGIAALAIVRAALAVSSAPSVEEDLQISLMRE